MLIHCERCEEPVLRALRGHPPLRFEVVMAKDYMFMDGTKPKAGTQITCPKCGDALPLGRCS